MSSPRILPVPDKDSESYWAALANGRLELQHCGDCGHWTWPARPICSRCQSESLQWEPALGTGEVHSWIITYQPYSPDFVDKVPYTVVLVRLDEQADILIPGPLASAATPRQGMRVHAVAERASDSVGLLNWVADEESQ
jgi:uncharacterized OB-fold protein